MKLTLQSNVLSHSRTSLRRKKSIGFVNVNRVKRYTKWCEGFFEREGMFHVLLKRAMRRAI